MHTSTLKKQYISTAFKIFTDKNQLDKCHIAGLNIARYHLKRLLKTNKRQKEHPTM